MVNKKHLKRKEDRFILPMNSCTCIRSGMGTGKSDLTESLHN